MQIILENIGLFLLCFFGTILVSIFVFLRFCFDLAPRCLSCRQKVKRVKSGLCDTCDAKAFMN